MSPQARRWRLPRLDGRDERIEVLGLVALTLVTFLVRLPLMDQSLTLDEPRTFVMADGGLDNLFSLVTRSGYEISPPFYFLLAWAAAKLGDPTVWVRVPSLVLGTATVPLTYVLGRETVGKGAGALGASFLALSPLAIRHATEARPYATVTFLLVVATLLLLWAARSNRRLAWVLYAVCALAVLYTHYFGALILFAHGLWALWACRDRLVTVGVVYGAVALGFLPWIPSFLGQFPRPKDYAAYASLTPKWIADESIRLFPGNGHFRADEIPGTPAVVVLGLTLGLVIAVAALTLGRRRSTLTRPSQQQTLLVLIVLVTALGLLLVTLVGDDNVWVVRFLSPALPAFLLLLGWLVMAIPRPLAWGATAAILGVLVVGTARSEESRFGRAAYKDAAHYIDSHMTERDILYEPGDGEPPQPGDVKPIDLNFERPHRTVSGPPSTAERLFRNPPARGSVFVAGIDIGAFISLPRPAPGDRMCALRHRAFGGIGVYQYVRVTAPGGNTSTLVGPTILLPSGAWIPVRPGSSLGSLDAVMPQGRHLTVTAWALDDSHRPAGCLLVFDGRGRLQDFGPPTVARPDLAHVYGESALGAGFSLRTRRPSSPAVDRPSGIRVFALADGAAAEIRPSAGG